MEKESKYYSIIENLVRTHKKFPGLEAILEDIIEDVYSHSEVILNTVSNDAVLNAYLSKVVSTSMITVPKRMNFHSELNHRVITHEAVQPAAKIEETYTKVDNNLVDKMINFPAKEDIPAVENEVIETIKPEIIEETEEIKEVIIESSDTPKEPDCLIEEINLDEFEVEENTIAETLPELTFEEENHAEDLLENEEVLLEDEQEEQLLVEEASPELIVTEIENAAVEAPQEKLIYEEEVLAEESIPEDLAAEAEETQDILLPEEDILPEALEEEVLPEIIEEISLDEQNTLAEEALPETMEAEEVGLDEELCLVEQNSLDEEVLPETIETEETSLDEELCISDDLLIEDECLENFDDVLDTLNPAFEDNSLLSEETEELDFKAADDDDEEEEEEEEEEIKNFISTDYSKFEFTPENTELCESIDCEVISKDLEELDNKHPELNIVEIYNLKYKDSLPVSEISSKLEMSENKVIEALNEIIAVL